MAGALAVVLVFLVPASAFGDESLVTLNEAVPLPEPTISPPPGEILPPLDDAVDDLEEAVGGVVGTVEETLNPPGEEPPPPGEEDPKNETQPPTSPTDPSPTNESQTSTSGPLDGTANNVGAAPGLESVTIAAQTSQQPMSHLGPMTQVLIVSGDLDPISYVGSGGSRSTTHVLQLLRSLKLPPATVAKILAPFPVAGAASYSDDWGQPRYTPYFHPHEGTDIFAEPGTPVIASARGTISDLTPVSAVGGTTLQLTAPDGTYFYYAHLSGFAPGLFEGKEVALGEVIGYVGHSGNAEGTPDHLHYEIHPRGGRAVPPVPYLDRWLEEALRSAKALQSSPSSGLGRFLARVPAALGAQGQNLASHLNGDPADVSTRATFASWGAILGAIGGTLARRRLRGRRRTFAEDPLEYVAGNQVL